MYGFALGEIGLRYSEVRDMTFWELNMKSTAWERKNKLEWHKLRVHAYLVSVYSGLTNKGRKNISPEKMLSLKDYEGDPDPEEIQEWHKFFARKTIKKTVYN